MANAYILMTAMPPTKGHVALIDFADKLPVAQVHVIVSTQPEEPFSRERWDALTEHYKREPWVFIHSMHRTIEQDPQAPGFWDMWRQILADHGMTGNDIIVASETYGQKVADLFGAKFIPYDPNRELLNIKATEVRRFPMANFSSMIPEFQNYLRKRITIFGAESVGKTTLSRELATALGGHWLFEYARPYLETVGPEITDDKMETIWMGQLAIQNGEFVDKPFIVQDTDLFSTVGYWEMWSPQTRPLDLLADARATKSDLYLIPQSNIPFEPDQLRYGGNKRESPDKYWIDLCEREGLNYKALTSSDRAGRLFEALGYAYAEFQKTAAPLTQYERQYN